MSDGGRVLEVRLGVSRVGSGQVRSGRVAGGGRRRAPVPGASPLGYVSSVKWAVPELTGGAGSPAYRGAAARLHCVPCPSCRAVINKYTTNYRPPRTGVLDKQEQRREMLVMECALERYSDIPVGRP